MMACCCSLAGTAACDTCSNRPGMYSGTTGYNNFIVWNSRAERTCRMKQVPMFPGTNCNFVEWECSACGKTNREHKPDYCPNCGARVEKGDL